uniref:DNA-directed RNA polymerase subunit beta' n=1 Tax=Lacunastrum gracillimum TaxID=427913 RepID=A0A2U8GGT2_9CHLO|nr:beta subunit of RNA polymerase [Lacunastrum gracillimum]AWI68015.1 beta subunit of RNA polymerase [Lacunastrum gracillimum]
MNSYLNLLKKENFLLQKNQTTNNSPQLRSFFFQKEKSRFFFIKEKIKNPNYVSKFSQYSIICSVANEPINAKSEIKRVISQSFIFSSTKEATIFDYSQSDIVKEKKIYDLNFIKKLNRFNFLLKNNATNKWVNWVFRSFDSVPSLLSLSQSEGEEEAKELKLQKDQTKFETKSKKNIKELRPKNLYKSGYSKIHELKLISVEIASPEKIKEWAEKVLPNGKIFGEVTNANTLHYKTFKPHKGGLFCERIFGPLKDFECACGVRSKPIELESYINENAQKKRFFCINCDVEYTWSVIRRYQLGYIQLISPVSHIWFLKANPSYLSLLLDFRRSHLESIIYCTESITLENLWKSSQSLGLDTSPSTLYSIWQKLLEEETLIKRKHKEMKKIPKNINVSIVSLLKQNKKRLNFINSYKKNQDLFYKTKNLIYNSIVNSLFLKNKILSNNQSYNYEKFYEKNLKLIYKKTFFQVLLLSNKSFLFSLNLLFFKDLRNKLENPKFKQFVLSQSNISEGRNENNEVLVSRIEAKKRSEFFISNVKEPNQSLIPNHSKIQKNLVSKMQIISNIYEKDIMKFKEDFLIFAESFFQIYFTKLYLKDKNFIIKIPKDILQLLCEFFIFYFIQIQLNFYNKKNPLNNLPKILPVFRFLSNSQSKSKEKINNKFKKSLTYNKKNKIIYLNKIKQGNNKILKVSSKIKKAMHAIKGLLYYTGICLFKKQIKLNTFFQKNKKIYLNFSNNKETTYNNNLNNKNYLFEDLKLHLDSKDYSFGPVGSLTFRHSSGQSLLSLLRFLASASSLREPKRTKADMNQSQSELHQGQTTPPTSEIPNELMQRMKEQYFIPKVEKKQTNLLKNLISEIQYKKDILSQQKNRKNVSNILYLLYELYRKEIIFYKNVPKIEYKQNKKISILNEIYCLTTLYNMFYIKMHKSRFSEIVNFNNLINNLCKIPNNKKNKLTNKYNVKENFLKKQEDSLNSFAISFFCSSLSTPVCLGFAERRAKANHKAEVNSFAEREEAKKEHIASAKREPKKTPNFNSDNSITLRKSFSKIFLNKKNTLNQRKKHIFLQKQKSLILRNPQFFSSIYSKKIQNNPSSVRLVLESTIPKELPISPTVKEAILMESSLDKDDSENLYKDILYTEMKDLFSNNNKISLYPKENLQHKEEGQVPLQKKMLKNDLYTISYNHLWPLNADWKSFFYYNSAPKDFEDTHIYYSYRKNSFYTKSNKFNSKLDIASQIDDLFFSDSIMIGDLGSSFGNFLHPITNESLIQKEVNSKQSKISLNHKDLKNKQKSEYTFEQSSKAKIARTTEFLSNIKSPLAGAAIVKKLLSEYTPSELKKMVKQHQVLLPKLNHYIRQLKEKAIKKFDFVKIQKLLNKRDHIIRRLKLIRKFSRKNVEPTSMILSVLPVLPPDLRPILKLQNQIAASDLNRLYQRIIYRNERLKKFLKDPSTSQSFEMKYAQRLLQEAVDNLIQNGKGNVKPETNSRGQALKSLSEILKGKQGRFRQYLLGKRVDYSGRSVIVVGPKLKLYECGLPKEMAIELFLPFLIKRILHYRIARTVIGAKNFLYSNKTYCINLLNEIMTNHPVLLNRAPTLHRLGIQAFQPKLVEGRAILLHPLVCPAFNADFDGDQMAVHLPITVEARAEAWTLIFSRNHLISPATGDPIVLPSQDMVLGCYYLTSEKKIFNSKNKDFIPFSSSSSQSKQLHSGQPLLRFGSLLLGGVSSAKEETEVKEVNEKKYSTFFCISNFFNLEKVLNAYQLGKISLQSIVWIKWNGKTQFANEPLSMMEIRLNRYGIRDQIQSKSYKRIDKEENLLNKYIRTTPGRILINSITQKCMVL